MVSQPKDLSQSESKELPDLKSNDQVTISDSTNECFAPEIRKASPVNKEKDLPDWTSRIAIEEWILLK